MAVMRNSIIFGGVDSADFGIYISGEGVFNAPKRAVEYIQVPGRNGAFALDQGYYENIEVTYPGFNYESDMDDFCDQLAGFRNAICSQKGYQRLSDTFHPNEYRMAVYSEGLEIEPMKYNTASNFKLKFNCKPQRYLTSGETELTVTSGQTITNPTLFDSSPLLAVKGYGTIAFNGYTIEIDDGFIGPVKVVDGEVWDPIESQSSTTIVNTYSNSIDYSEFSNSVNAGDDMTVSYAEINTWCHTRSSSISIVSGSGGQIYGNGALSTNKFTDIAFTAFPSANQTQTSTVSMALTLSNSSTTTITTTFTMVNKPSGVIEFSAETSMSPDITQYLVYSLNSFLVRDTTIDSTVSLIGNPTYIDCDLGEAYMIKDGTYIGLNSYIDLGSDLPTLGAGNNTVTFSNTVTQLKLTPRWWQI